MTSMSGPPMGKQRLLLKLGQPMLQNGCNKYQQIHMTPLCQNPFNWHHSTIARNVLNFQLKALLCGDIAPRKQQQLAVFARRVAAKRLRSKDLTHARHGFTPLVSCIWLRPQEKNMSSSDEYVLRPTRENNKNIIIYS